MQDFKLLSMNEENKNPEVIQDTATRSQREARSLQGERPEDSDIRAQAETISLRTAWLSLLEAKTMLN